MEKYLDKSNVACRLQAEYDKNGQIKTLQSEINNINKKLQQNSQIQKELYLDKLKGNMANDLFSELNSGFNKYNTGIPAGAGIQPGRV